MDAKGEYQLALYVLSDLVNNDKLLLALFLQYVEIKLSTDTGLKPEPVVLN